MGICPAQMSLSSLQKSVKKVILFCLFTYLFIYFESSASEGHGRIIKWTQHRGFLTLVRMERVVDGNHREKSKRRVTRFLC